MATFSCTAPYPIRCSSNRDNHDHKQKLNNIRIIGASSRSSIKADILSQKAGVASTFNSITNSVVENGCIAREELRQNIPTKKQSVDPHRQGLIIEGGVGYRQTVVIRSYEVGPDKTATLESILNLLQVMLNYSFQVHPHAQKHKRSFLQKGGFTHYIKMIIFLEASANIAGNSIKPCVDVWASGRWIWCHTRNGTEQSYMGCLKDAGSSRSLPNLVSPIIFLICFLA